MRSAFHHGRTRAMGLWGAMTALLLSCGGQTEEATVAADRGAARTRQEALRQQLRPMPTRRVPLGQLEAAVAAGKATAPAYADLAGALLRSGSYRVCLDVLEAGLTRCPDDARLRYVAGEAHKRVGDYDQAVGHLQALVALVPDFADGHFSLGAAFAHRAPAAAAGSPAKVIQADLDSAVAHCGTAVSLEPDNPVFHYNLGRALHLQNEFGAAAAAYQRAIELGHDAAQVQRQLGKVLEKAGDLVGARAALGLAVAADSTDAEALYLLAKILDREGQSAEAAGLYRRSIALRPDVAEAHYNLALVCYRLGQEEDGDHHMALFEELNSGARVGVRALELGVQRTPADAGKRRALASAYADAGRDEQAAEELRIAAALEPDDAATLYSLGLMLARTDRLAEAASELRAAVEGEPRQLEARFQLAVVLLKQGHPRDAAEELQRIVDQEPLYPKAAALLEAVHSRLGDRQG